MNRTTTIVGGLVLLIAIAIVSYLGVSYFFNKPAQQPPTTTTLNYLLLTDTDSGTTTPISFPSEFIVQIPETDMGTSSTSIIDPDGIVKEQKIQSYNSQIVVSGTISKPGIMTIINGPYTYIYTFVYLATTSPLISP